MVERGSLENCWRRKALVGSNPTPSAFVPVPLNVPTALLLRLLRGGEEALAQGP